MEENLELETTAEVRTESEPELPAAGELPEQELIDFVLEHPGLDAASIPGHVWDSVKKGESLGRAYGRHELQQLRRTNQQLEQELGTLRRSADSRFRSLGSMRSSSAARSADSFLTGFNDDD